MLPQIWHRQQSRFKIPLYRGNDQGQENKNRPSDYPEDGADQHNRQQDADNQEDDEELDERESLFVFCELVTNAAATGGRCKTRKIGHFLIPSVNAQGGRVNNVGRCTTFG